MTKDKFYEAKTAESQPSKDNSGVASGALIRSEKSEPDIKVGLYSITYLGVWYRGGALSLEDVILRAKGFGYTGIEIDGKRPHGNPLDMPKARCEQLRNFAESEGIEIYAVAANNDFSSPIPEHRESQLVYVRQLISVTRDLGVKLLRVFLAWPGVTVFPEGGGTYDVAKTTWRHVHETIPEEQTWEWCRQGLAETARYAGEHGITLALQNHPPVINGYQDCLRMLREIGSPYLKVCFDGRLEKKMNEADVERATREVGRLQVLSHYGGEYDEGPQGVTITPGEKCAAEIRGLVETGYQGYLSYELCHPLPLIDGKVPAIDFVDKNARIAAIYMKNLIQDTMRLRAAAVGQ
ncbi:MAG: sugar phosphate isomerase/epimerase family protein [Candidatus Acidiferrales bacterium]